MAAIYPHRWTSAMGDDPNSTAGDTWAKGLTGLSAGQLANGLEACLTRNDAWPPTLPEFRALCLDVPTLAEVKADLLGKSADRSPFTLAVWRYIDAHAFRRADQYAANRMLAEAYEIVREQVMRGVPLPTKPVAIVTHEQPPLIPADPERVQERLDEIRELLHAPEVAPPAEVPREPIAKLEEQLHREREELSPEEVERRRAALLTRAHTFGEDEELQP
jgi:hypothetical protein